MTVWGQKLVEAAVTRAQRKFNQYATHPGSETSILTGFARLTFAVSCWHSSKLDDSLLDDKRL